MKYRRKYGWRLGSLDISLNTYCNILRFLKLLPDDLVIELKKLNIKESYKT